MNALKRVATDAGRPDRVLVSRRVRRLGVPATFAVGSKSLLKADRPRAIDRYIDYFGGPGSMEGRRAP
jgi:hypothetical protein